MISSNRIRDFLLATCDRELARAPVVRDDSQDTFGTMQKEVTKLATKLGIKLPPCSVFPKQADRGIFGSDEFGIQVRHQRGLRFGRKR